MSLLARLAVRLPLARATALRCTVRAPAAAAAFMHFSAPRAAAAAASSSPAIAGTSVNPVKYTTHIAGLDVVPNGREVLMGLYKETLASIEAYNAEMGREPSYNANVRTFTQHRLRICEEEESHEAIERRIWFGQIEELIESAEDELDLLVAMNEEVKPWEVDESFRAEVAAVQTPNFGESREDMERAARGEPAPISDAEKAEDAAYWAAIDAEIKEDQAREAAEKQSKQQAKK